MSRNYELVIHLGYGKTGTTALQVFLKENRILLKKHGILYPDFKYMGMPLNLSDHNFMANALVDLPGWLKMPIETYFLQINKQVNNNPGIKTVLLSGENFSGMPRPYEFKNEDDYWNANERKLARLKTLTSGTPCKLIVYIRRQDEWLEASLNQTIKYEGLINQSIDTTFEAYMNLFAPRLD